MALLPRLILPGDSTGDGVLIETELVPLSPNGVSMIILAVFLSLLTALWTGMRVWCRRAKGVPIAPEDWLNFAALAFFYGQVADNFVAIAIGGSGHHINELQHFHVVRLSKSIFALQVLYALSVGCVKLSITVMLMRIFFTRKFRIAAICVMALSVAWMIMTILAGLLLCQPVETNWNPQTPGGKCGNQNAAFVSVAAVDVFNEICLLLLPVPMVWRLQISRRYKVGLACVFGTGVITMIISIIRIPLLLSTNFVDLSYDNRSQMIALAEPAAGIMISSSPILRPIFDKVLAPFLSTKKSNGSNDTNDLARQTIGGSNRSHFKAKSSGFREITESEEHLELGDINPYQNMQDTEISAVGRSSVEVSHNPSTPENGVRGIRVMKETIVSRDDERY